MTITTGILRADEQGTAARILARSFGRSEAAYASQLRRSRRETVFALRDRRDVIALCTRRDRDIGVAGRLVRTACLSSLCVDPERRGVGLGSRLFTDALLAAARDGLALAWLCADRPQLYERHGAVVCGHLWECTFDPRAASNVSTALRGVVETRADAPRVDRFVRRCARAWSGRLVFDARERSAGARTPRVACLVTSGDEVRARAVMSERSLGARSELVIHDLAALDIESARAALAFVASQTPVATVARVRLTPDVPLVAALTELGARFEPRRAWLVCVLAPDAFPGSSDPRELALELFAADRPSLPGSS